MMCVLRFINVFQSFSFILLEFSDASKAFTKFQKFPCLLKLNESSALERFRFQEATWKSQKSSHFHRMSD